MQRFEKKEDVVAWLNDFHHPDLVAGWASTPDVVSWSRKTLSVTLPFAANPLLKSIRTWLKDQVTSPPFSVSCRPVRLRNHLGKTVQDIKNIIAVTSAKGGVGKSTIAVNLALALSQSRAEVGLLDADIYGPSIPTMLGTTGRSLKVSENKWMQPIYAHGLHSNSIGYLMDDSSAAIWRGPMASKALQQLLNETVWPELDYLVIDMPPGTGDLQLTLAQQIPVTSVVVVTTPHALALADAVKGIAMFDKLGISVAGFIENMSYHICGQCGHTETTFGTEGADQLAEKYEAPVLARFPLNIQMSEGCDKGAPVTISRPNSRCSTLYLELSQRIASRIFWQGRRVLEEIPIKNLDQ